MGRSWKRFLAGALSAAMVFTSLPAMPATVAKAETTAETITGEMWASGGQKGNGNVFLIGTDGGKSANGSDVAAAYKEGVTAIVGDTGNLGSSRIGGLAFEIPDEIKEAYDAGMPLRDATVTIHVTDCNQNLGTNKTKAGLYAVSVSYNGIGDKTNTIETSTSLDASKWPAKDNDYSYEATVYSNEWMERYVEQDVTFDVEEMVTEFLENDSDYAIFRLQTVVSGFLVAADVAPKLDITFADDSDYAALIADKISIPTQVTGDIDLPTTADDGATVSWNSTNEAVIANDGTVTRPEDDTVVTLTATVAYNGSTAEKSFDVTVISSKILMELDFDTVADGVYSGRGVTGTVNGTGYAEAEGVDGGKAIQLTGSTFVDFKNENGKSPLTGKDEFTISYYSKAQGGKGWTFFATPVSKQSYQSEKYIGVADNPSNITVEKWMNSGGRTPSLSGTVSTGEWRHVVIVINEAGSALYVDGAQVATVENSFKPSEMLGENSSLWLGKANWDSGEFYQGYLDNFTIYDGAYTAKQVAVLEGEEYVEGLIQADLDAISISTNTITNIDLPTVGAVNASDITWESSDEAVITNDGKVTLTDAEQTATLTATATFEDYTATKTFDITVRAKEDSAIIEELLAKFDFAFALDNIRDDFALPAIADEEAEVVWSSSNEDVITIVDGKAVVTRQEADETVTLTATVTYGTATDTKDFEVTVIKNPKVLAAFDFEEDAVDGVYTGTNAIATIDGVNCKIDSTSYVGNSLELGDETFLTITNAEGKNPLTGVDEFTVSYWSKPAASGNNGWAFFTTANFPRQKYPEEKYIGIIDKVDNVGFEKYNNTDKRPAGSSVNAGGSYTDWKHVVLVMNNAGGELFVDGVSKGTVTYSFDISDMLGEESALWIGKANWDDNEDLYYEYYGGNIDNFTIYEGNLTENEIKAITADLNAIKEVKATKDALIEAMGGKTELKTETGLTLPVSANGLPVTWESSNSEILGDDGSVVVRPESDTVVYLTATIGEGDEIQVIFAVTVPSEKTDAQAVEEVLASLTTGLSDKAITGDFTLPTSGEFGTVITWASSNEDIIVIDGGNATVTRPTDKTTTVTLTATVTRGEESDTKEFTVKVSSPLLASYKFTEDNVNGTSVSDLSGNENTATIKGSGATVTDGALTLPGGAQGSTAAYVEIPGDVFVGKDTLTINIWLQNKTGSGNYAAMSFGTPTQHLGGGTSNMPLNYWILNPAQPSGYFKSVWTNSNNASAPYNTETAVSTTKTSSDWGMYTTVITPTSIKGYYNGELVTDEAKTKTTTDFGTDLVAAIGRSGYNDMFYKGGVADVDIYDVALSAEQVENLSAPEFIADDVLGSDADTMKVPDLTAVRGNFTLPTEGERGSSITWTSLATDVIAIDGGNATVTRPIGENVEVTLIATLSYKGYTVEVLYVATVLDGSVQGLFGDMVADLSIGKTLVNSDIELPLTAGENTTVTWTSSDSAVISVSGNDAGVAKVTRPAVGEANAKVTLTATVSYDDGENQFTEDKEFVVTVEAEYYGYLLAYTNRSEGTALGNSLHLAYGTDGANYTALNSNTGICFANNAGGSKSSNPNSLTGLFLMKKSDGTYVLLARNGASKQYIYVFESTDLINFTNETQLATSATVYGDITGYYDENSAEYVIYWTDSSDVCHKSVTKDFVDVKESVVDSYVSEQAKNSDVETMPDGAKLGHEIGVSEEEYNRVVNKLGVVTNTSMEQSVTVSAKTGDNLSSILPKTVTAGYSDGSDREMVVNWNATDISKVDLTKSGTYTVTGTIKQTQYENPFIEQRADPCICKGDDGYYYFTASYPMLGGSDKDGYDKVVLRRAKTIEGLQDAEEITIWDCDDEAGQYRYIWAPEIHCIDGEFYVFYTASVDSSVWSIRPHVLKCTNTADIMNPSSWKSVGRVLPVAGDGTAFTAFSLDMTIFENQGRYYIMWAQTDGFSSLWIAEVDKDEPWKCISEAVKVSVPEFSWERVNENVNEGPSVIKNNGMIYVAFSAAATGPEYCVGLLSIPEDADLLVKDNWYKQPFPVLTSSDVPGEYGPGHNSFTVDEDGNAIFVYHARGQECYDDQCGSWATGDPLYDPCRDARIKRVHWAIDGAPILKMSYADELKDEFKTITATVNVTATPGAGGGTTDPSTPGAGGATEPSKPVVKPAVTKVKLAKTKVTLGVKEKYQLEPIAVPANAETTYTYATSNKKVATVDAKGKITAKKTGKANITVTSANGKKVVIKVTVKKAPNKITVTTKSKTLKKGKSFKIKYKLPKNTASNAITFKSSNKKVATVDAKGKVKALKKGKATITVQTFNKKKAKIKITVK